MGTSEKSSWPIALIVQVSVGGHGQWSNLVSIFIGNLARVSLAFHILLFSLDVLWRWVAGWVDIQTAPTKPRIHTPVTALRTRYGWRAR